MIRQILLAACGILALCLFLALALTATRPVLDAGELDSLKIYAYRDWQSTAVTVSQNDLVSVRARGMWLYTPGEWHGPEGHARYRSPQFYPLPGVPGGALIGRIGETGIPFYVGTRYSGRANSSGMLYLRIDDDILSDNEGQISVDVTKE